MHLKHTLAKLTILAVFSLTACTACPEVACPAPNCEDTNWELTKKDYDIYTIYEGEVIFHGWIVDVPFYTGDPEPHFRVSPDDHDLLPKNFKLKDSKFADFKLREIKSPTDSEPASEETIEALRAYSESNPVTLLVKKIRTQMEGSASLYFAEVVD